MAINNHTVKNLDDVFFQLSELPLDKPSLVRIMRRSTIIEALVGSYERNGGE